MEDREEEEKVEQRIPGHGMVFDPENPPFETQRLCIYLRELEEGKERK